MSPKGLKNIEKSASSDVSKPSFKGKKQDKIVGTDKDTQIVNR
jgi:hypothetical protein